MVLTVIVVNAVAIFLRAFPQLPPPIAQIMYAVDYGCTVFFVVEMLAKIKLYSWRGYIAQGWNRFDFVVVMASASMLLGPILHTEDFSFLGVLRLARLFRSFRLLRFIPDAEKLWAGAKRGLRASVGVVMALALYNVVLGLCACHLFRGVDPVHFGDPLLAIYSMFKVFTVEGWFEIADGIAQHAPGLATLARAFFMFSVTTGGLLGLSLANAVFVDEMIMDNNADLEADIVAMKAELSGVRRDTARALALLERLVDKAQ